MLIPSLFLLAAVSGPPPYAESLACAASTRAAYDLAEGTPQEPDAFDAAMFWALATMEAARRDGLTAKAAEAAQLAERDKAKPPLQDGNPAAKAALAACLERVPDIKG